jgi:hypothetical protein
MTRLPKITGVGLLKITTQFFPKNPCRSPGESMAQALGAFAPAGEGARPKMPADHAATNRQNRANTVAVRTDRTAIDGIGVLLGARRARGILSLQRARANARPDSTCASQLCQSNRPSG